MNYVDQWPMFHLGADDHDRKMKDEYIIVKH